MRSYLIPILFLAAATGAVAQQNPTFAQYMFNGLAINPAYAGSQGALSASFLARMQNVGLPGAPNTQTFTAHTPLLNQRMGLGVLFVNDRLSVIGQSGFHVSYAYRLPINRGGATLSFGLQAGGSFYNAEYSQLDLFNNPGNGTSDPAFSNDVRSIRPNIGAGVYFTTKLSYVGLSMPSMANNVFERGNNLQTVYQAVPLILTAGHVFTVNRVLKLKPNFLLKLVDNRPVEYDLNLNALFDEVLWVGASFKSSKSVVTLLQFKVNDQLQLGYTYTITTGPLRTVELGTHEFMVNYRFWFNKRGVVTPRYF
ncbi:MAG: type IX secretion system membrane protein PorP/SprF [Bacteroidota bacterium]